MGWTGTTPEHPPKSGVPMRCRLKCSPLSLCTFSSPVDLSSALKSMLEDTWPLCV